MSDLLSVNLLEELGITKLPKEQQEKMQAQMVDTIQDRLSTRVLVMLSEDDKQELDKVLDSEDGDLMAFYQSKIPNFDQLQVEIIAEFKREMLELNATARKAIKEQQDH